MPAVSTTKSAVGTTKRRKARAPRTLHTPRAPRTLHTPRAPRTLHTPRALRTLRTPRAPGESGSGVDARVQLADVRQIAVALGEVQAVAHHELVGDVEADLEDVEGGLDGVRLAQQRDDLERPRVAGREVAHEPRQGQAGIDDVLDDDDVAVGDVAVQVLEVPHDSRGAGRGAVRADRHELHLGRDGQRAGEVGDEDRGALEHADQDDLVLDVLVLLADRGAHL